MRLVFVEKEKKKIIRCEKCIFIVKKKLPFSNFDSKNQKGSFKGEGGGSFTPTIKVLNILLSQGEKLFMKKKKPATNEKKKKTDLFWSKDFKCAVEQGIGGLFSFFSENGAFQRN